MATPVETVSDYISAVGRSKLLEEGELITLRSAWEKDSGGSEADVDSFRRFLQRQKKLSEYQAKLIQRGRSEGFIIGDYIVLDRIGSGQTAGVYQARHSSSGQVVALKVLPSSKLKESTALNRFQREGRLLTQLDHPNVVRAFQLSQAGTIHFIVMEHLEGETLDAVLDRRKKLPVAESVRLVHQALQGLQHLHEKRMVHRDLKPSNLMISPPGDNTLTATVKILDIGLGREMFDEETPSTRDLQLTGEGALLGTPDYLAPEQARDARNADIRADIYSLGCVLFHLIAGRPPFVERNVMAQMVKHATETAPLLGDVQPGVPRDLTTALAKMLDKDPNRRPQTPIDAAMSIAPFLPDAGKKAEKNVVLPAYQKFLEESSFEMPVINPAPQEPPKTQPPAKSKSATDYKPARPVAPPPPVAPALPKPDFVDVELVTLPAPVVVPQPLPLPKKRVEDDDDDDDDDYEEVDRSLLDLNKRDFIMLGAGSLAILVAIGAGWVLSRATRKRDDEDTPPGTTTTK